MNPGKHRPARAVQPHASLMKIAGVAGIAAAAATVAMSVGAGTAQAAPLQPNTPTTPSTPSTTAPLTAAGLGSVGSFGSLFNPGPFTFGRVTNPPLKAPQTYMGQFLFTPAVPGSRPFASIQGFQLPFWSVTSTGAPVPFA